MSESMTYRERLGHNTWNFLSVIVEGYPTNPDQPTQMLMERFIQDLALIYPCSVCREGFINYVSKNKPVVCCRNDLYKYLFNLRKFTDMQSN